MRQLPWGFALVFGVAAVVLAGPANSPYPSPSPFPGPSFTPSPSPAPSPSPTTSPIIPSCMYRVDPKLSFLDPDNQVHTVTPGEWVFPNTEATATADNEKVLVFRLNGNEATISFTKRERTESLQRLAVTCSSHLSEQSIFRVYRWTQRPNGTCEWKSTQRYQTDLRQYSVNRKANPDGTISVVLSARNLRSDSNLDGLVLTNDETFTYNALIGLKPAGRPGLFTLIPIKASAAGIRRGDQLMSFENTAELDLNLDSCEYSQSQNGSVIAQDFGNCTSSNRLRETSKTLANVRDEAEGTGAEEGFHCSNEWIIDHLFEP